LAIDLTRKNRQQSNEIAMNSKIHKINEDLPMAIDMTR